MKAENTYLIIMSIWGIKKNQDGKKLVNHSSIINYGEDLGDGTVKYLTKGGVQVVSIFTFDSSISILKLNSICLEKLMDNWKRTNKENSKPIVLDETIDTQEIFENDFSPLMIMVERRENEIAIKPIFDAL